jgi:hypothetical protein
VVDPSGPHTDLEVEIPIVIGSTSSSGAGEEQIEPHAFTDLPGAARIGWLDDMDRELELDVEEREEEDESDIDSDLDSEDE